MYYQSEKDSGKCSYILSGSTQKYTSYQKMQELIKQLLDK